MLKVGLTGGIGSGKSTVAECFAAMGIPVIDTDAISHQLSLTPAVLDEIRDRFGDAVITEDGYLDRSALAAIVFSDTDERMALEGIMHPKIRLEVARQYQAYSSAHYVIVVVPLLLETDFHELVDRILVVDISEEEQVKRVIERDLRDEATVRKIISSQVGRQHRLDHADDVIDNNGEQDALEQRIVELDELYKQISHGGV